MVEVVAVGVPPSGGAVGATAAGEAGEGADEGAGSRRELTVSRLLNKPPAGLIVEERSQFHDSPTSNF